MLVTVSSPSGTVRLGVRTVTEARARMVELMPSGPCAARIEEADSRGIPTRVVAEMTCRA